jgi:hypothetical protein
VPHATSKISEDTIHEPKMAINVEIAPGLCVSGPSGSVSAKIMPDSLSGKENLPRTETPLVEDLEYIVRYASGKKLSREQIAEVQHYARDLKYPREVMTTMIIVEVQHYATLLPKCNIIL